MSGFDLKVETRRRIETAIGDYTEQLIGRFDDPAATINHRQGIILGLRLAVQMQEDAHKAVGG